MSLGHEFEQHLPWKVTEDPRGAPTVPEGDSQPGVQCPMTTQSSWAPATAGCPGSGSAQASVTCRSIGVASLGLPGCGERERGDFGPDSQDWGHVEEEGQGLWPLYLWGDLLRASS